VNVNVTEYFGYFFGVSYDSSTPQSVLRALLNAEHYNIGFTITRCSSSRSTGVLSNRIGGTGYLCAQFLFLSLEVINFSRQVSHSCLDGCKLSPLLMSETTDSI